MSGHGNGAPVAAPAPRRRYLESIVDTDSAPRWRRRSRYPLWRAGALAVVIAPILVAGCRALIKGFSPLADNGILVVRASDVLTRHNPLLGSWTSASIASGRAVNNPGPLYFDLIALPVKLLGPSVGLVLGVMAVNVAAVSFAVLVADRLGGRTAMAAMATVTVVLEWTMGSELLFDVWQPNALVLPALAFGVAVWGVACGRAWFLPFSVAIGSLLVQTHLSYVYLVPVAFVVTLAFALTTRSVSGDVRRPIVATGVVALVAWVQPLVEQFTSSGQGNVSSLVEASQQESQRLGARLGVRILADLLTVPPFWGRPSYETALPPRAPSGATDDVPATTFALATTLLLLLVLGLAATIWWNRRRGRPMLAALGIASLALMGGSLLSLTLMPFGVFGLSSHQMRWIWPVGALVTASLLMTAAAAFATVPDGVSRRRARAPGLAVPGVLLVVATGICVLAFPTRAPSQVSSSGPMAQRVALPAAEALGGQLGPLEGRGTVLFDLTTIALFDPYNGYLFAQLQERDVPFVFEDEATIRQLGEGRRYRGDADLRIWLRTGAAASAPLPPSVERVAFVSGLTDEEAAELTALEARLRRQVAGDGLELNKAGRSAVADERLPATALDPEPGQHPFEAIGDLNLALEQGWIDYADDQDPADFERLLALRNRQFYNTVALFAAPVGVRPRT